MYKAYYICILFYGTNLSNVWQCRTLDFAFILFRDSLQQQQTYHRNIKVIGQLFQRVCYLIDVRISWCGTLPVRHKLEIIDCYHFHSMFSYHLFSFCTKLSDRKYWCIINKQG